MDANQIAQLLGSAGLAGVVWLELYRLRSTFESMNEKMARILERTRAIDDEPVAK